MTSNQPWRQDLARNATWWDGVAELHGSTELYRASEARLRRGGTTLSPEELRLAGDLKGARLLHVGCHLGHDSISWARRGAVVTALDFSAEALANASRLAQELGEDVAFLHSEATDLPTTLSGHFDVVVASRGVYPWMPDLDAWAREVARCLTPGGPSPVPQLRNQTRTVRGMNPAVRSGLRNSPSASGRGATCTSWRFG